MCACILAQIPFSLLAEHITWEAIDATQAKATITYNGLSASGIFTFSDSGQLLTFMTEDRSSISAEGTVQQVAWSVLFKDYKTIDGIKQPTHLQIVWNYDHGDLVYFDGNNFTIELYPLG